MNPDSQESLYHDPLPPTNEDVAPAEGTHSSSPLPPTPVRDTPSTVSTTSSAAERLAHLQGVRKRTSSVVSAQTNSDGTIPNRPPSTPIDPEEEEAEKVLNSELVSDEELSTRNLASLVKNALIDLFIIVPIMTIPSLLVFLLCNFTAYEPWNVKGPDGLHVCMEFIRYNIFAVLAYILLVVADILSLVIPETVLLWTEGLQKNAAVFYLRHQMRALIAVRHYVTAAVWLLALMPLAGFWLYKSSFMTTMEFFTKFAEKMETTKAEPAELDKLKLAKAKSDSFHSQLEAFLLILSLFSVAIAFEKYVIEMIRLYFHRRVCAQRIHDSNIQFKLVSRLYEAITKGKPKILSRDRLKDRSDDYQLEQDRTMLLTSYHRAKSVAKTIFRSLVPSDRDHLIADDFKEWLADYQLAFDVFDTKKAGQISQDQLEGVVISIYEDRVNLMRSLVGNSRLIDRLDSIFLVFAVIVVSGMSSPVFDLGITKILSALSVLMAGFAFIFKDAAKSIFDSMIFVFIQNTFDVGDRILIDDESFVVEHMDLLTSKFVRWDGVTVYIPNSVLSGKAIVNVRRSEDQCERVALALRSNTTTESLWKFRSVLQDKLINDKFNYTGQLEIVDFDKMPADASNLTLSVVAQMRGNFQNPVKRNQLKADLLSKIEASLAESNIARA